MSKERLSWFFTDTSQKRYHLRKPDQSVLYNITLSCYLLSLDYFVSVTWNLCKSMEFEKSSLMKQKLLPHTEKYTHMYFVVDANLSIFDSDAIQICVSAVSF